MSTFLNKLWRKYEAVLRGVGLALIVLFFICVVCLLGWHRVYVIGPLRETCLNGTGAEREDACRQCAGYDYTCKLEYQHGSRYEDR